MPNVAPAAMNQKNLNYEIETTQKWHRRCCPCKSMNQKNLNYEIETYLS